MMGKIRKQLFGKFDRKPARIILLNDCRKSPTVNCHKVLNNSFPLRERLPLCKKGKYMQPQVRVLKSRMPLLGFEFKMVKQFECLISNEDGFAQKVQRY